jgi:hypothetical protein
MVVTQTYEVGTTLSPPNEDHDVYGNRFLENTQFLVKLFCYQI